jgi:hypothetical protein
MSFVQNFAFSLVRLCFVCISSQIMVKSGLTGYPSGIQDAVPADLWNFRNSALAIIIVYWFDLNVKISSPGTVWRGGLQRTDARRQNWRYHTLGALLLFEVTMHEDIVKYARRIVIHQMWPGQAMRTTDHGTWLCDWWNYEERYALTLYLAACGGSRTGEWSDTRYKTLISGINR